MHTAAAAALGLDLIYLPLAVRPGDLPAAVAGMGALGFRGANVTAPHKVEALALMDHLTPAAKAIGALNTISYRESASPGRSGRTWEALGENTDWKGFAAHLDELGVQVSGRDCLVLGAGGAARGVAYALLGAGAIVHLYARRPEQAATLAAALGPASAAVLVAHPWSGLGQAAAAQPATALVVNATPVGLSPHAGESPWPDGARWPAGALAYDLNYSPSETLFMRQAAAAGLAATNGLRMLVHQAALAFELWTGRLPDRAIMARTLPPWHNERTELGGK
jgi:shikimate dehydrogenase